MLKPELPDGEELRIDSLRKLDLLDSQPEERFDSIVRLAGAIFRVPIALVSLVDVDRQWFKACYGLDAESTSRDVSFCGHAIHRPSTFIVENALEDSRFSDNPLVTGEPHIRFYAGRPLAAPDGQLVGTLCIIDTEPRLFSEEDNLILTQLANVVEREMGYVELLEVQQQLADAQKQSQRALQTQIEQSRLRKLMIEANTLAEQQRIIDTELVSAMQGLGWRIAKLEVHFPSTRDGYYVDATHIAKNFLVENHANSLADRPWIGEVWQSRSTVVVGKERLHAAGIEDTCCLIEIPLEGGGSVSMYPSEAGDCSIEDQAAMEQWVELFDLPRYRENVLRELKMRVESVKLRIQNAILQMERVEDFESVVSAIGEGFHELDVDIQAWGVNLIDEQNGVVRSYNYLNERVIFREVRITADELPTLIHHWKRNEVWERSVESRHYGGLGKEYKPSLVIDVPFVQGSLAAGLRSDLGCNTSLIEVMVDLCSQISVASLRLMDLSKRDHAEEQMRDALKQAEEARAVADGANRAKSEFLANMSHEIRTPMNAILGMTELVLDSPLNVDQRESLGIVQVAGKQLMSILNDILDLSKIEAGKLDLERIGFDLREECDSIVKLMESRFVSGKVELRYDALEVSETRVLGDPVRLRQVVVNLLGNAAKFTESGWVELAIGSHLEGTSVVVDVSVRDTGIGIAKDKLQSIFGAFQQEDASTTRRFGGTGLGLSICAELVKMMGGSMDVQSQVGEGSTFSFTVRLDQDPDATVSGADENGARSGRRALLLADDPFQQVLVSGMLDKAGWTVVLAGRDKAPAEDDADGIDIALVDMDMKIPDWEQRVSSLRDAMGRQNIHMPILGLKMPDRKGQANASGAAIDVDALVMKPVRSAILLAEVNRLVR